jgi:hypothetical protein
MYSDEDGVATKHSEAQYNSLIQRLVFTTCVLSWVGLGAAVVDGEYTRESLNFSSSLQQPSIRIWSKLLWVSCVYFICSERSTS